jgi:hypothetical protein
MWVGLHNAAQPKAQQQKIATATFSLNHLTFATSGSMHYSGRKKWLLCVQY